MQNWRSHAASLRIIHRWQYFVVAVFAHRTQHRGTRTRSNSLEPFRSAEPIQSTLTRCVSNGGASIHSRVDRLAEQEYIIRFR